MFHSNFRNCILWLWYESTRHHLKLTRRGDCSSPRALFSISINVPYLTSSKCNKLEIWSDPPVVVIVVHTEGFWVILSTLWYSECNWIPHAYTTNKLQRDSAFCSPGCCSCNTQYACMEAETPALMMSELWCTPTLLTLGYIYTECQNELQMQIDFLTVTNAVS